MTISSSSRRAPETVGLIRSERIDVGYLLCDGASGCCSLLEPYSVAVPRLMRSPPEPCRAPQSEYLHPSSSPPSHTTRPTAPPLSMWRCSGAVLLDGSRHRRPRRGSLAERRQQVCQTGGQDQRLASSALASVGLQVQFDPGSGRVRVEEDQSIPLQSGNVILVDEVNSAAGPRILETIRVEPRFPSGRVDIDTVVRRHSALFPFLRCDVRFPDQPQRSPIEVTMWRQMTDLTCARLRDAR